MPPTKPVFTCCQVVAFTCLWLVLQGYGMAAGITVPTMPRDGIRDDARAMTGEAREALAAEMKLFEQRTGIVIVIDTNTYLEQNVGTMDRCRALLDNWIGERPGVVFCMNRSVKPVPFLAFSRALSERYPEPDLSQAAGETTDAMANMSSPENRVPVGVRVMMERLRSLEKAASRRSQLFHHRDLLMMGGFSAFLLLAGAVTVLVVRHRHKVEDAEAVQHHFPDVEVAQRFAAPSGGGVVVEMDYKR
ncbi:MAG: hypothetical protein JWO08_1252 [Verrucomicrobiaceae bacterium]|nr:hypothetical protein [Verrucomicrobiaceae bacterium]